jgi:penicillin amidase
MRRRPLDWLSAFLRQGHFLLRFLRRFLIATGVVLAVMAAMVWWYAYRPLPQIDGAVGMNGLKQSVQVERDEWGVPHIRAASLEDLLEAQGYVVAQDRLWQMDLLRRVASGELAEILGGEALASDRTYRTLGLRRAAERDAEMLEPEMRVALEAYARGVNQYIAQHRGRLPLEFSLLRYSPRPWKPADTLVIAGYMYQTLTNTWRRELNRAKVTERVGPERARELFSQESEMDHPIVGGAEDRANGRRSHPDPHDDDEDEIKPQTLQKTELPPPRRSSPGESSLWQETDAWLAEASAAVQQGLGSNNWVVSGEHTASGKPLLANDTHLELTVPPIWYLMHLTAPGLPGQAGWNVKGFTLPGAPLVIIGHNDRIAWGFTNSGADVEDLYAETFDPSRPEMYRVRGKWGKAQIIEETIHVRGQPDEKLAVVVTRHGPVVEREGNTGYALRWTALEPGALNHTYNWLGRAQNWDEFRNELKKVWGPGQNAVYADVDGNIGYVMAARVPVRKKGRGEVPVPGDTDDYEWMGYIPFDQLPQASNPPSGVIATANARVVGPKYKPYLTDRWEAPYRTARIYDLLRDKQNLRPADFLAIQTDTYSYPHAFLAELFAAASKNAQPQDARAQEMVKRLGDWNGIARPGDVEPAFLEAARVALIDLLLEPYLRGDTRLYQWRSGMFLQKVLRERPERWLPKNYRCYDELLMAAADRAAAQLERVTKKKSASDWTWAQVNSLEMDHALGRRGLLRNLLSITGKPQAGTLFSIRAAQVRHGPAMRFIADLGNWDDSILLIPAGQSGQFGSAHYRDQFPYWYEGKPIEAPFREKAVESAVRHRLELKPGP